MSRCWNIGKTGIVIAFAAALTSPRAVARPAGVNECGGPTGYASTLVIENLTDCSIDVYIDGKFVGTSNPCLRATVRAGRHGEVVLVGRYRCDTWGPKTLNLQAGRTTTLVFTEMGRTPRGG